MIKEKDTFVRKLVTRVRSNFDSQEGAFVTHAVQGTCKKQLDKHLHEKSQYNIISSGCIQNTCQSLRVL